MKYIKYLLLLCLITACNPSDTKPTPEGSIESPVITNDLSNQKVTAFAEDAQGHIWIGTSRGVNKYNVHEYHQYTVRMTRWIYPIIKSTTSSVIHKAGCG